MAFKMQTIDTAYLCASITAEMKELALNYLLRYPAAHAHHAISFAVLQLRK